MLLSRNVLRAVVSSSSKLSNTAAAAAVTKQCHKSFSIRKPAAYYHETPTVCTCTSNSITAQRLFCQQVAEMTVDFDYVKNATANTNILIVDVREPDELKEHGKIPNSINIPLGNVSTVLSQMSDKDFQQKYEKPKPSENTEIIFYCMIGKRSGMAQENALKIGFKNVKNYLGSFTDWAAKSKA